MGTRIINRFIILGMAEAILTQDVQLILVKIETSIFWLFYDVTLISQGLKCFNMVPNCKPEEE